MKKTVAVILILVMVLCFCSCSKKIEVPDVLGVDESSAKSTITNKGLIPVVEYSYSDDVSTGCVFKIEPSIGEKIDEDSKVTLYVSMGPKHATAKSGTIQWLNASYENEDDWYPSKPYFDEGTLYIPCDIIFGSPVVFEKGTNGSASLSSGESYPIILTDNDHVVFTDDLNVTVGGHTYLIMEIPMKFYGTDYPSHLECKLFCKVKGETTNIRLTFDTRW